MRYKIYVHHATKKEAYWISKEDYNTYEKAEKKINKTYKRQRAKIITLPDEFEIGTKLYSSKGKIKGKSIPNKDEYLYGTIIDEDNSFWYINRAFKDEDDSTFFLKDNFEDKFVEGIFHIKEEDY